MSYFNRIEQFSNFFAVTQSDGQLLSYQALAFEADKLASAIGKRTLVFSLCSNSIESLVGYVGFLRNDIVPVLVDNKLTPELFTNLQETYEPAYVWLPESLKDMVPGTSFYSYGSYTLIKTIYSENIDLNPELGLLLTTSGSTGSPKLVRQSYRNIEANTESICEYLKISSSDRPITTLPMSYTYGLSIINSHLNKGSTILMTDYSFMQKEFWIFLKENKATTFGGVPYTYQMLKRLRFFNMEIPSLKYLTQAGGKLSYELSLEVATKCKEKGLDFIVMYGQTEATARMSYLPAEYAIEKCGSMGIAIPGGEFWLQDDDGNKIVEPDTVGELVYKGENVTLGYAQCKADLSLGDERKGILVTGDMAKFDVDGFYSIVGRKKRFVKLFGSRVNLDETERLLQDKGYVCACCGIDDRMSVYTENIGKEAEIHKVLSSLLNLNMTAFAVQGISAIPKNEAGKTLYSQLENL
ncbi:AMP-binding protein [uncultured Sphaerochaeta sp.]|uniref:AMP-binding protein n=1 Tax=uncultured Sphaerochaeta sp. TaxID=886478 RepID=UPI002A0A7934|nr:AMP-binding protein [uncultured Sphaerochaeta sp.]